MRRILAGSLLLLGVAWVAWLQVRPADAPPPPESRTPQPVIPAPPSPDAETPGSHNFGITQSDKPAAPAPAQAAARSPDAGKSPAVPTPKGVPLTPSARDDVPAAPPPAPRRRRRPEQLVVKDPDRTAPVVIPELSEEYGAVYGQVHFAGVVPGPVTKFLPAGQADHCGVGFYKDETIEVGSERGLKNVVVELGTASATNEPGSDDGRDVPVIDQRNCRFQPHVIAVRVGEPVYFLNSDPLAHNVNIAARKNPAINETIAGGSAKEVAFTEAEKIPVACNIHPWMAAVIAVVDSHHSAVTNAEGEFLITGVRPGTYPIRLWHEKLGRNSAGSMIDVKAGEVTRLNLSMSPKVR